ncbi:MAG: ABC transporter ATP-binding protein [Candidatus Poribacteria bacterium]|nr:ABC transporter ATP-binding protein [Candidatus Poribacteria bacterium]MDE0503379.1 ABC transporter ATP-binding protein [Candidatus Poribacteria bacterium]
MNNLIRTVDLHKSYFEGAKELRVLKGIDIEVDKGEILAIVGASGVGKSTLLHLIGGLDRPTQGKVYYENQDIFEYNDRELDRFRNLGVGFVFQFHHLLPEFTAIENVALGALISGKNVHDARADAGELLDYVGLSERLEHHPSELSGGERQRVAIARAIINQPKVVLADEPTGNLDRKTSAAVLDLLWDLNDRFEQTFIVVTHNQALAQRADRVIQLVDGKLSDQIQMLDI